MLDKPFSDLVATSADVADLRNELTALACIAKVESEQIAYKKQFAAILKRCNSTERYSSDLRHQLLELCDRFEALKSNPNHPLTMSQLGKVLTSINDFLSEPSNMVMDTICNELLDSSHADVVALRKSLKKLNKPICDLHAKDQYTDQLRKLKLMLTDQTYDSQLRQYGSQVCDIVEQLSVHRKNPLPYFSSEYGCTSLTSILSAMMTIIETPGELAFKLIIGINSLPTASSKHSFLFTGVVTKNVNN